jgi:hypothetical protein
MWLMVTRPTPTVRASMCASMLQYAMTMAISLGLTVLLLATVRGLAEQGTSGRFRKTIMCFMAACCKRN